VTWTSPVLDRVFDLEEQAVCVVHFLAPPLETIISMHIVAFHQRSTVLTKEADIVRGVAFFLPWFHATTVSLSNDKGRRTLDVVNGRGFSGSDWV
jgi:hypothetical protein